jgi:hypothetical protein
MAQKDSRAWKECPTHNDCDFIDQDHGYLTPWVDWEWDPIVGDVK